MKRLYLLCPTDCLEPIVNATFSCDNFFYYSLGNSFHIEENTIETIKDLIKIHKIEEVSFVLSDANHILKDALGKQSFVNLRGLRRLYLQILRQKKYSELFYKNENRQFSILSYYLNNKIKELELELRINKNIPLEINAKIYDRREGRFKDIYSDLICMNQYSLN